MLMFLTLLIHSAFILKSVYPSNKQNYPDVLKKKYKRLKEIYNSILHTLKKALMTLEKCGHLKRRASRKKKKKKWTTDKILEIKKRMTVDSVKEWKRI